MPEVRFHEASEIADEDIRYAVIMAKWQGRWVFCRHKDRATWEIPGGHREHGETPMEAATRELYEETGACDAIITPVCLYSFHKFGALFYAEIKNMENIPAESEIKEIAFFDSIPEALTYPHIQPYLFQRVNAWLQSVDKAKI